MARTRGKQKSGGSKASKSTSTSTSTPVATKTPASASKSTGAASSGAADSATPTLETAATTLEEGPPEFDFEIKGRDLQRGDVLASKSNDAPVPTPPPKPADGIGYVATLPTTASGKNKTPLAVAEQYKAEAFDDPSQAASRLAMVVGVNGFISATEDPKTTEATLQSHVDEAATFTGFRLHAFSQRWSRKWVRKSTKKQVSADEVWGEVSGDPDLLRQAREAETAAAANKNTAYKGVINWARNEVTGHPQTSTELTRMTTHWSRAMMHVADPDAVNLKAEKTAGAEPTGLLDRWDEVLGENPDAKVATGGYNFREKGEGDDPHAGSAAKALPQTKQASDLDMRVRDTMAKSDAAMPYYPEPNLMIDANKILEMPEGDRSKLWGKDGAEWPKAKAALDVDADEMLFDKRATLYTDAGRFDDAYTKLDPEMARGKTAAGPLFDNAAQQSHAKTAVIRGRLEKLEGLSKGAPLVEALIRVFLPQEMLDLNAAATASDFERLKGLLETARDNAEKVGDAIKSTAWADISMADTLKQATLKGVLDTAGVNTELTKDRAFLAAVGSAIQHKGTAAELDTVIGLMVGLCQTIAGFLLDFVPQTATPPSGT